MGPLKRKLSLMGITAVDYADGGDEGIEFAVAGVRMRVLDRDSVMVSHLVETSPRNYKYYLVVLVKGIPEGVPVRGFALADLLRTVDDFAQSHNINSLVTLTTLLVAMDKLQSDHESQEIIIHRQMQRELQELSNNTAARASRLTELIDSLVVPGRYIIQFDGFPASKEYSTLKAARRAHSKRNLPHVPCTILSIDTMNRYAVAEWNVETRLWTYMPAR